MNNKRKLYSWLRRDGLSHEAASGILGNLKQESGYSPEADNGSSRGIAQWLYGGRWDDLTKWASQQGKDPDDLRTQYEFMLREMRNGGLGSFDIDEFKQMGDARKAADYFEQRFEGSNDPTNDTRMDNAENTAEGLRKFGDRMPDSGDDQQYDGPTGQDIVDLAKKYVGTPYRPNLGAAASPQNGWDCSRFTWWILRELGYKNPPYFSENYLTAFPKVKS